MNLNRATSNLPDTPWQIEPNVLYVGDHEYQIDGIYRFWITKQSKFGQHTIAAGYYSGDADNLTLTIPKNGAVSFDRYPYPLKPGLEPAPVPDIIQHDAVEQRIVAEAERIIRERFPEVGTQESIVDEISELLSQPDEEDEDELYVSDYALADLPQELESIPAEQQVSESEQEDPRVGGDPEDRGEQTAENQQDNQQ